MGWLLFTAITLGHVLEITLVYWVLTNSYRSPAASVAWILAIVFIPVMGPLTFLVFGLSRVESRRDRRRAADAASEAAFRNVRLAHRAESDALPAPGPQIARVAVQVCDFHVTSGNTVEVIADTNRTLGLISQAIEAAEETLHLEYYIWEPDRTGRMLRDRLIDRAREGVKVRFLYDSFGSFFLRRRFLQPMIDAGIEVASFIPGNTFRDRWSINLRSHRKIVVADGRVGFTGGMNIGDEYLGKRREFGFWRDTHARIEGPAVAQLQRVFCDDWFYSTGELLDDPRLHASITASGDRKVQIIAGGPVSEPRPFHALLFAAINEARHEVLLTTSYFIPTDPLAMVLATAALRGVRVRIIVPGRNAHRVPLTIWAGRAYYDALLAAGVEIHEYDRGILHSKTLVVDRTWSMVGTPNYDNRSVSLNFEVAATFFDAATADELVTQFKSDLNDAYPVTAASRAKVRPVSRAGENLAKLFAPVL